MKKYMARRSGIKEIDALRETDASIFIADGIGRERRVAKRGSYENYFSTWNEDHEFLVSQAERKIDMVRRQLEMAKSELGNVKGMKKPA